MAKKTTRKPAPAPSKARRLSPWVVGVAVIAVAGSIALAYVATRDDKKPKTTTATTAPATQPATQPTQTGDAPGTTRPNSELQFMEVNKAVMVTVELDYGPQIPTIEQALRDVERRYEPEDGQGRTFAILDAYGEPTADGKLHMSMHVSSEKTGMGYLSFRRTGETLWQCRITPGQAAPQFGGKNLRITIDDGKGNARLVDGSSNPPNILAAMLNDPKVPVSQFWPDGEEREVTFFYSACGCPVHVQVKRVGNTTARVKDLPVLFPDDPAVVVVIKRLMGWA